MASPPHACEVVLSLCRKRPAQPYPRAHGAIRLLGRRAMGGVAYQFAESPRQVIAESVQRLEPCGRCPGCAVPP